MQRHPSVPWILFRMLPQGGFLVVNERTREQMHASDAMALHSYAADQARVPGHIGAGDVVASAAKAMGFKQCTPCAARRAAMNAAMPRVWRR